MKDLNPNPFGREETPRTTALRKLKIKLLDLAGTGMRTDFMLVQRVFKLVPELRGL